MAQAFVHGSEFSSWTLCIGGEVRVQTFYECPVRAGRGAGCAFVPLWADDAAKFVELLAKDLNFTGSLAFDFMRSADGKLFVLECNPRLTSGIHVLDQGVSLSACLERRAPLPPSQKAAQLRLAVLFSKPRLAGTSPDVITFPDDPWPTWGQACGVAEFAWRAVRHRVSLLSATTWDLEYNGA
jgi:hypothetical protein